MWYEINVSLFGIHYFATDKRSIVTRIFADRIFSDFQKLFTVGEGFEVTMTQFTITGKEIKK